MLDAVPDLIGRKLIAPKQKTQAEMNVFFQGALWNLAERYTDMVRAVLVHAFLWAGWLKRGGQHHYTTRNKPSSGSGIFICTLMSQIPSERRGMY